MFGGRDEIPVRQARDGSGEALRWVRRFFSALVADELILQTLQSLPVGTEIRVSRAEVGFDRARIDATQSWSAAAAAASAWSTASAGRSR